MCLCYFLIFIVINRSLWFCLLLNCIYLLDLLFFNCVFFLCLFLVFDLSINIDQREFQSNLQMHALALAIQFSCFSKRNFVVCVLLFFLFVILKERILSFNFNVPSMMLVLIFLILDALSSALKGILTKIPFNAK